MAFGIKREELIRWKQNVNQHNLAFVTHYWLDPRFPGCNTVTKVGCGDINKLLCWGAQYGLKPNWLDQRSVFPHFDLVGSRQLYILKQEKQWEQIKRFNLE